MALIVQKYGGTSLADASKIRRVAERVVATRKAGNDVVAVVSAMGHHTDELVELAQRVSPDPPPRELDMLLTAGERISMSLLAMAIADLGTTAKSFTGSQAGIITDTLHGKARILDVRAGRITDALAAGHAVIVAGFQGVSTEHDVTTLGRGGSDTTAVALAAALGADACEIYTDVRGVFSADPRLVANARKLDRVSFEEMLEMASSGAGVMMARSVEIARTHNVRLNVRSSFEDDEGTWITEEDDPMLEKALISAVVHQREETVYRARGTSAATLFGALASANVNVDTILQSTDEVVFSAPPEDKTAAAGALESLGATWECRDDLGKVSVIGAGMKSHPGVAAKTFAVLEGAGIAPAIVSTSPIKIACHIPSDQVDAAVRALHDAFELA
jgi:aspartate kinase